MGRFHQAHSQHFLHVCLRDTHTTIDSPCQSPVLSFLLRIIKSGKYSSLDFCLDIDGASNKKGTEQCCLNDLGEVCIELLCKRKDGIGDLFMLP